MEIIKNGEVVITHEELVKGNYKPTRHDLVFLLWSSFLKEEDPRDVWGHTGFTRVGTTYTVYMHYKGKRTLTVKMTQDEFAIYLPSLSYAMELGSRWPAWCIVDQPVKVEKYNKIKLFTVLGFMAAILVMVLIVTT